MGKLIIEVELKKYRKIVFKGGDKMLLNNNVLLFLDIVPNYDRGLREYERIEYKEIKVDDTIGN
ncbi:hypothetical protein AAK805_08890 [Anaerosalibacter bizertensis]